MKCGLLKGVIQHSHFPHGQLGKYKEKLLWNGRKEKSKSRAWAYWIVRAMAICLQKHRVERPWGVRVPALGVKLNHSNQVPCSAQWATLKTALTRTLDSEGGCDCLLAGQASGLPGVPSQFRGSVNPLCGKNTQERGTFKKVKNVNYSPQAESHYPVFLNSRS